MEIADATPVKLVPKVGTTTMIERSDVIESYNDGYEVITDSYDYESGEEDSTFYDEWYIYGLAVNMTKAKLGNYFEVQGDGRYELITTKSNGGYGTGCIVKVYDRNGTIDDESDDIFVEQFFIVIFGDLDGNGRITQLDYNEALNDLTKKDWSANRGGIAYMKKAADLNDQNGRITQLDVNALGQVVARASTIDQKTGKAS